MRVALVLVLAISAAGCTKKDPPAATDRPTPSSSSSLSPPPSSSSEPSSPSSASPRSSENTPKTSAEIAKDAKPPLEASLDDPPVERIKTKQGKLVVWAAPDGESSLVLAAYESKPGELTAPAKIVRKTSGKVMAVAAVVTENEDVAIAWASSLLENKGQLAAVVFTSPDLAKVTPPKTLGIVNASINLQGHIGVAKTPRGGVVVAHQGPGTTCKLLEQPTDCLTFEVKWVSTDGSMEKLGGTSIHGGPSPEFFFVDLKERGLLVYGSSMRGGRTMASVVVPWSAKDPAPSFEAPPECGGEAVFPPSFARGTKDEVVSLCIDRRPEKGGACAKPISGDAERCLHIGISAADGKPITAKTKWDTPITKIECLDGKPKLTFPTGEVTLTSSSSNLTDFIKKCGS